MTDTKENNITNLELTLTLTYPVKIAYIKNKDVIIQYLTGNNDNNFKLPIENIPISLGLLKDSTYLLIGFDTTRDSKHNRPRLPNVFDNVLTAEFHYTIDEINSISNEELGKGFGYHYEIWNLDSRKIKTSTSLENENFISSRIGNIIKSRIVNQVAVSVNIVFHPTRNIKQLSDVITIDYKIVIYLNDITNTSYMSFDLNIQIVIENQLSNIKISATDKYEDNNYIIIEDDVGIPDNKDYVIINTINSKESRLETLNLKLRNPHIINNKLFVMTLSDPYNSVFVLDPLTLKKQYDVPILFYQEINKESYYPFVDESILAVHVEPNAGTRLIKYDSREIEPKELATIVFSDVISGVIVTRYRILKVIPDIKAKRVLVFYISFNNISDDYNFYIVVYDDNLKKIVNININLGNETILDVVLLNPSQNDNKVMGKKMDVIVPTFKNKLPSVVSNTISSFL